MPKWGKKGAFLPHFGVECEKRQFGKRYDMFTISEHIDPSRRTSIRGDLTAASDNVSML